MDTTTTPCKHCAPFTVTGCNPATFTDVNGDDLTASVALYAGAVRVEIETAAYTTHGVRYLSPDVARDLAAQLVALANELDGYQS
jgi:hypothetical protein